MLKRISNIFKKSKFFQPVSLPFHRPILELLESRLNPSFSNMSSVAQSIRMGEDALPQVPGLDSSLGQMLPTRLSDVIGLNAYNNGVNSWSQFDSTYPNPTVSNISTIASAITSGSPYTATISATTSGIITGGNALTSGATIPSVTGLGGNNYNNSVWTLKNGQGAYSTISNDVLTLTQSNNGSQFNSYWYNNSMSGLATTPWTASFTYTNTSGTTTDGFSFSIQTQGTGASGGIWYGTGINPSLVVAWDEYNNGLGGTKLGVSTGGNTIGFGDSVAPVNLISTNTPTNIVLGYDGVGTLTVTMTQGTNTFTKSYGVNLSGLNSNAYMGFAGGQGGAKATTTISNFVFRPQSAPVYASLPDLNISGAFSVQAWVNTTNNTNANQRIIDFGYDAGTDNIVLAYNGSGGFYLWTANNGTQRSITTPSSFNVTNNTWHQVSATSDANGNAAIYVDGVLAVTGTISVPRSIARANSYWGKSNWSNDPSFQGQQDELRIWNRALSSSEIAANYNWSLQGTQNGLLANYHADETSGTTTTLADSSGNGKTATINSNSYPQSFTNGTYASGSKGAVYIQTLYQYSSTNLPTQCTVYGTNSSNWVTPMLFQVGGTSSSPTYTLVASSSPFIPAFGRRSIQLLNFGSGAFVPGNTYVIGFSDRNGISGTVNTGNIGQIQGTTSTPGWVQTNDLTSSATPLATTFNSNNWFATTCNYNMSVQTGVYLSTASESLYLQNGYNIHWSESGVYNSVFSTGGLDAGLHLNKMTNTTLPINVSGTVDLTLALDSSNNLVVGSNATWSANASLSNLNLGIGLGYLDSQIQGGSYSLSTSAAASLPGGATGGVSNTSGVVSSLSGFTSANASNFAQTSGTITVSGSMPFTGQIGGQAFTSTPTATLASQSNVSTMGYTQPLWNLTGFGNYLALAQLDAAALVNSGLNNAGGSLASVSQTSWQNVPFSNDNVGNTYNWGGGLDTAAAKLYQNPLVIVGQSRIQGSLPQNNYGAKFTIFRGAQSTIFNLTGNLNTDSITVQPTSTSVAAPIAFHFNQLLAGTGLACREQPTHPGFLEFYAIDAEITGFTMDPSNSNVNGNQSANGFTQLGFFADQSSSDSLQNSSFEGPNVGTSANNPAGSQWVFNTDPNASNGITVGGYWISGTPADGTQFAYMANASTSSPLPTISQNLVDMDAGSYQVTFSATKDVNFQGCDLKVTIDDTTLQFSVNGTTYSYLPGSLLTSSQFQSFTSNAITLTAGNHTLKFKGLIPSGTTAEARIGIDKVSIITQTLTAQTGTYPNFNTLQGMIDLLNQQNLVGQATTPAALPYTDTASGQVYINGGQTYTNATIPTAVQFVANNIGTSITPLLFTVVNNAYTLVAAAQSISVAREGLQTANLIFPYFVPNPSSTYVLGFTDRLMSVSASSISTTASYTGTVGMDYVTGTGNWIYTSSATSPSVGSVFAVKNIYQAPTISNRGSGYITAPTVTITDSTGTGATATASLTTGVITGSISLTNAGNGYSSAPTVTITDSTGTGATASAIINGYLIGTATINNGGTGYSSAPTVTLSGGGGSGATATATISNGTVTSVSITGGSGYTAVPSITIAAPTKVNATASATLSSGAVSAITITNSGGYYSSAPTVTFNTPSGGTAATGTAVLTNGVVTSITITNAGHGYTTTPTITIGAPTTTGTPATASLSTSNNLRYTVSSISVTNMGSGYTTPTVTISAPSSGTTATATIPASSITGVVSGITITNGGWGYSTNPTVTISAPTSSTATVKYTATAYFTPDNILSGTQISFNRNYAFSAYQGLAQAGQGSVSRPNTDTSTANSYVYTGASYNTNFVPSSIRFYANTTGTITPLLFTYTSGGTYQAAAFGNPISVTSTGLNETPVFFPTLGSLNQGTTYLFGYKNSSTGVVAVQNGASPQGKWLATGTNLTTLTPNGSFTTAGIYSLDIIASQTSGSPAVAVPTPNLDANVGQVNIDPTHVFQCLENQQASEGNALTSSTANPAYGKLPDLGLGQYSGFTVQAWFNSSNTSSNKQKIIDFGNGENSDNIILALNAGKLTATVYNGSTGYNFSAGSALSSNTWYHVSAVFSGSTTTLYLNGQSIGSYSQMPLVRNVTRANNFWGKSNSSYDPAWQGQQDELRIWNRALTASEIASNYNQSFTAPQNGLIGNYKADETDGTDLLDNSSHGNDAVLYGSNGLSGRDDSTLQGLFTPNPIVLPTAMQVYATIPSGGSGWITPLLFQVGGTSSAPTYTLVGAATSQEIPNQNQNYNSGYGSSGASLLTVDFDPGLLASLNIFGSYVMGYSTRQVNIGTGGAFTTVGTSTGIIQNSTTGGNWLSSGSIAGNTLGIGSSFTTGTTASSTTLISGGLYSATFLTDASLNQDYSALASLQYNNDQMIYVGYADKNQGSAYVDINAAAINSAKIPNVSNLALSGSENVQTSVTATRQFSLKLDATVMTNGASVTNRQEGSTANPVTTGVLTSIDVAPGNQPFGVDGFLSNIISVTPGAATYSSAPKITIRDAVSAGQMWSSSTSAPMFANLPDLNLGSYSGFTIQGWFNSSNIGSDGQRLIDLGAANGSGNANIIVGLKGSALFLGAGGANFYSSKTLASNTWYHASVVFNGTTAQLFVNGALTDTFTITKVTNVARSNNYWGKSNWSSDPAWQGQMDELRVWSRALSTSEIAANYNTTVVPAGVTGLLAYYLGDETSGNTLMDNSGNGRNATLVNSIANPLANNSFETPSVANQSGKYQYAPTGATWVFSPGSTTTLTSGSTTAQQGNGSGIACNQTPWYSPNTPTGNQAAFIQGIGSATQTFPVSQPGAYQIGLNVVGRSGFTPNAIKILVDGVAIDTVSTSSFNTSSWTTWTSKKLVTLGTGNHTLTIQGVGYTGTITSNTNYDVDSAVDNVTMTYVPLRIRGTAPIGATGTGASAVANLDPNTGRIASISLTNAGYGYSNPVIQIAGNTPATARATLTDGVLRSINTINLVSGSTGYLSAPKVTIIDSLGGVGSGATATATINSHGVVTAITLTNAGSGYSSPVVVIDPPTTTSAIREALIPVPTVTITDTGGSGATAAVSLDSNGYINGVVVANNQATATVSLSGSSIGAINITNGGQFYTTVPTVTIADSNGGTGSGATATATLTNGIVTAIQVTNTGSDYSNPVVTISAPPTLNHGFINPVISFSNNTPATAKATTAANGTIGTIVLPPGGSGSGYTTTPRVTITDSNGGKGTGAAATATVINGVVTYITVTNAGSGYMAPVISIDPPPHTQAVATAASGKISGVAIPSGGGGKGYITAPVVTISDSNGGTGSGATATAIISNGVVTGISVTNPGAGYRYPVVSIAAPQAPASGTLTINSSGKIQSYTLSSGGYGYTAAPTVTILDSNGGTGSGAKATATISSTGVVTSVTITNSGSGYSNPLISFSAPQGGQNATANATVESSVSGVAITNGGAGYTSAPTITIWDSQGGTGTGAIASAVLTNGVLTGITLDSAGTGYSFPMISISAPQSTAATATTSNLSVSITNGAQFYGTTPPVVTITDSNGGTGTGATATASLLNGVVTNITINNPGTTYSHPIVTIAPPITATAVVTQGVMDAQISDPGKLYNSTPNVTITDSTGPGTGATAYAVMEGGQIVDIVMTSYGTGYESPVITIDPPTVDISQAPSGPSTLNHTFYFLDGNSWSTTTSSNSGISLQYQLIDQLTTLDDRAATGLSSANGSGNSVTTANNYNLAAYLSPLLSSSSPTYALTAGLGITMPASSNAPLLWYMSAPTDSDPAISEALFNNNYWSVATIGAVSMGNINLAMNLSGTNGSAGFTGTAQIGYVDVNLTCDSFTPDVDFALQTTPGNFNSFGNWQGILSSDSGLAQNGTTSATINQYDLTFDAYVSSQVGTLLGLPSSSTTTLPIPNVTFSVDDSGQGTFSNNNFTNAQGLLYLDQAAVGASFSQIASAMESTDTASYLNTILPFIGGNLQDITGFSKWFTDYVTNNLVTNVAPDLDSLIDWVADTSGLFTLAFGPTTVANQSGYGLYLTPINWNDTESGTTSLAFDVGTFASLAGGFNSSNLDPNKNYLNYLVIPPNNTADLTVSVDASWQAPFGMFFSSTGSGLSLGYTSSGYVKGSSTTNAWNLSNVSVTGNNLDLQGTLSTLALYLESDSKDIATVSLTGGNLNTTLSTSQFASNLVASSLGGSISGGTYSANLPVYFPTSTCFSGGFSLSNGSLSGYVGEQAFVNANVSNGTITGFNVVNGGSNYATIPQVIITDAAGVGTGAIATATISTSGNNIGQITGVTIINGGTGYVSPVVSFVGYTRNSVNPTGTKSVTFGLPDIMNSDVAALSLANAIGDPNVFQSGIGSLSSALQSVFTASMANTSQIIIGTGTSQFSQAFQTYNTIAEYLDQNLVPFVPQCDQNATASVTQSGGKISTTVTMITSGASFTSAPVVTISDSNGGKGSGATATANMVSDGNGGLMVGSITITNQGSGYSYPVIGIAPPVPGQLSADAQLYNQACATYNTVLATTGIVLDGSMLFTTGTYTNPQGATVSGSIPTFLDASGNPLTFNSSNQSFVNSSTNVVDPVASVKFPLVVDYTLGNTTIPFSFGMPGIPLSINNPADLNLVESGSATVDLSFGIDALAGFFITPNGGDQFTGTLDAGPASNFSTTVTIGFLSGSMSADTGDIFSMPFSTALADPNGDGQLTLQEINSLTPSSLFQTTLSTPTVGLNLNFELKVAGGGIAAAIPGIGDTMSITWTPGQGSPVVSYDNFYIDLGSFISDYMGAIAPQLTPITNGVQPILNALETPIPVLADIIGGDTSLLGLANRFGGANLGFVNALNSITEMVTDITSAVNYINQNPGQSYHVPISAVATFSDDFRSAKSGLGKPHQVTQLPSKQDSINAINGFLNKYQGSAKNNFTEAASKVVNQSYGSEGSLGISFDILDPSNIIGLVTGQTVDIFHINFPSLSANFSIDESFPLDPPLYMTFGGGVNAGINLSIGMDSAGLEQFVAATINGTEHLSTAALQGLAQDVLMNGLFIDSNATSISAGGYLSMGVELNAGLAKAGVEGKFNVQMTMTPNGDSNGRLTLAEMEQLAGANFSKPENLFDFEFKGTVSADAYLKLFLPFKWRKVWHHNFGSFTVFDIKNNPAPPQEEAASFGSLYLNMGPTANRRGAASRGVTDEHFEVRHIGGVAGDETLAVQSYINGVAQYRDADGNPKPMVYTHVDKVVGVAGAGDDIIDCAGVLSPCHLEGGDGKDTLIGGNGLNFIDGGRGKDKIIGGILNDTLKGGEGDDEIHGGGGTDAVEGGQGDDSIETNGKNHVFRFDDKFGNDNFSADSLEGSTLDFSKCSRNLRVVLGAENSITIGGNHTIHWKGKGPARIILGTGEDTVVFQPGYTSCEIDPGDGRDMFEVNAFEPGTKVIITGKNPGADNIFLIQTRGSNPVELTDSGFNQGSAVFNLDWATVRKLNVHETKATVDLLFGALAPQKLTIFANEINVKTDLHSKNVRLEAVNLISIQADIIAAKKGNVAIVTGPNGKVKLGTEKDSQFSITHGNIEVDTPVLYLGGTTSTHNVNIINGSFENGAKQTIRATSGTKGVFGTTTPMIVTVVGGVLTATNEKGQEQSSHIVPFPKFLGETRFDATADFNNDGINDIVAVPGPGGGPNMKIIDGKNLKVISSTFVFDKTFTGGVNVASTDVNGDGIEDIIIAADAGAGPHVRVFSGKDFSIIRNFFAYDPKFTGGVRVTGADTNGDGIGDIIVAPASGNSTNVRVFSGKDLRLLSSYFAFTGPIRGNGGVFVSSVDLNGDGRAEIVAGLGRGNAPLVSVYNQDTRALDTFLAYDAKFTGGVRVGNTQSTSGAPLIVTGAGPGGAPNVRTFDPKNRYKLIDSFFAGAKDELTGVIL